MALNSFFEEVAKLNALKSQQAAYNAEKVAATSPVKPINPYSQPTPSSEDNPAIKTQNPITTETVNSFEGYTKDELETLKKLLANYKKNPNLFKNLI
jgi:hypothetical protein